MNKEISQTLSDETIESIATKLNEKFNIPFMGEEKEQVIFVNLVKKLDEALGQFLPKEYYELVEIASDGISEDDIKTFKERIPTMLNKEINIPILSEKVEQEILEFFVELICDALAKDKKI